MTARNLRYTPIHQTVRRHILDVCNVFTVRRYQWWQVVWKKGSTIDILHIERYEHLHDTATVSQLTSPSTYRNGVCKCQIFDPHAMLNRVPSLIGTSVLVVQFTASWSKVHFMSLGSFEWLHCRLLEPSCFLENVGEFIQEAISYTGKSCRINSFYWRKRLFWF